jgi:hypothetical protein
MQLADDFGYRIAVPGNLPQPVLVRDSLQRFGQRGEAFSRARIGTATVIIVARKGRAPPEFDRNLATAIASSFAILAETKADRVPFPYVLIRTGAVLLGTFTRRNWLA